MLSIGEQVERYVVEDYLGHGGMAVVYRVRHTQLGTLHALKVLTVPRPSVRARLLSEGRAQAALRHSNVVGVTDVIEVNGDSALLLEHVDGPGLDRWLARYRRMAFDELRALARGVCEGVGEAHAQGFVHRDLKPANVLLDRTPSGFRPKVSDFGIAKILEETAGPGATRTNIAMGTPHYMAPEQIRDAGRADARADIFSIGCILYEAATGQVAFAGDDVLTVLNAVADVRYRPPVELVPDLPDTIAEAITGCLREAPDERFQSCDEILAALGPEAISAPRIQRGLEVDDDEFVDAELRQAREEWLGTGPPAAQRSRVEPGGDPAASSAPDDASEADTAEPAPVQDAGEPASPAPGDDVPASPASSKAPTVPRARSRVATPPEGEVTRPVRTGSSGVGTVRILVVSALLGILLGTVAFLGWAAYLGWSRAETAQPAPEPAPALDEVVGDEP